LNNPAVIVDEIASREITEAEATNADDGKPPAMMLSATGRRLLRR
jgi:hypothetical protein